MPATLVAVAPSGCVERVREASRIVFPDLKVETQTGASELILNRPPDPPSVDAKFTVARFASEAAVDEDISSVNTEANQVSKINQAADALEFIEETNFSRSTLLIVLARGPVGSQFEASEPTREGEGPVEFTLRYVPAEEEGITDVVHGVVVRVTDWERSKPTAVRLRMELAGTGEEWEFLVDDDEPAVARLDAEGEAGGNATDNA